MTPFDLRARHLFFHIKNIDSTSKIKFLTPPLVSERGSSNSSIFQIQVSQNRWNVLDPHYCPWVSILDYQPEGEVSIQSDQEGVEVTFLKEKKTDTV